MCPSVHPSVICHSICPSIFSFPDDNLSKCQWIFTKLNVSIDIVEIWFGIVIVKFLKFLTELSARSMSEFSFPDDKFSKCQWIFTNFGVPVDIVKIWFGIADGQISSVFDMSVFSILDDNFSKYQWIFTRLGICIALIWRTALRLLIGKLSIFVRAICLQYIRILL